ncbi:VanW family protein [Candidatus Dojkabacteria bacterium]|uniref:VanW family protein n=1 Tax=Candidatus Dojkabacteria bacterium TaxID=2099670 RepID=A0A955RKB2_9BACT|nr:VanW family protein [Candidatus Dojkabacteria bacterium]
MENIPELLRQKKNKLPVYGLIGFQIIVIGFLGVFLFTKTSKLIDVKKQTTGNVAGISTETVQARETVSIDGIPDSIAITIGDRTLNMQTQQFEFKINTREVEKEESESPTLLRRLINMVRRTPNEPETIDYITFNEAKLEYWVIDSFGDMEHPTRIQAQLESDEETGYIHTCIKGKSSARLPLNELFSTLKNSSELPEELQFGLNSSVLSSEEESITKICEEIEAIQDAFITVETENFEDASELDSYKFIRPEDLSNVLRFKLEDDEFLKVEIISEQTLENQLELLKVIADVEGSTQEFKTRDGNLYALGEYEPGRYLNIEKTLESLNEQLEQLEEFEYFPLVFDEVELEEGIDEDLTVYNFPTVLGNGELRFPIDPLAKTQAARDLLDELDAIVIEPNAEFSLVDSLESFSDDSYFIGENIFEAEDVRYSYFDSVGIVSSSVFRAALESGFPITSRLDKLKSIHLEEYGYPYSDISIATAVVLPDQPEIVIDLVGMTDEQIEREIERTSFIEDFTFLNDTKQSIILVVNHSIRDDRYLYVNIELYGGEGSKPRDVVINNMKREEFSQVANGGFIDRFTRRVNGSEEEFSIQYYK